MVKGRGYKLYKNYARVSMRKHRNIIQAILDAEGNYVYNRDTIVQESLNYYTNLFNGTNGTNFPPIEPRMKINDMGKRYLSAPIQTEEIRAALDSIHHAKGQEHDRFSSKFFKSHWDLVHDDLFLAITENFQ